jgi:hypothetical protein
MPENDKGGWPLCPICGDPMAISGDGPPGTGGHRIRCITVKDGVVVDKHPAELPPLGVNVSDTSGVAGKVG